MSDHSQGHPQDSDPRSFINYISQIQSIYDPLSIAASTSIYSGKIDRGYFDGMSNVFTRRETTRKLKELAKEKYYLLPDIPNMPVSSYTGAAARNLDPSWLKSRKDIRVVLDRRANYEEYRLTNLYPVSPTWLGNRAEIVMRDFFRALYVQCQVVAVVNLGLICTHP
jgi:hypothetical protein